MTKQKVIRNFGRWKYKFFGGKKENWENYPQSLRNCSEIGGNLKQGANASLPQGDGRHG